MSSDHFASDISFPSPASGFSLAGHGFSFGPRRVLAPYHLELGGQETVAILGPSGIGKSTLLRQIAGLFARSPHGGGIAWMAQQDLLLPWLTIRENVTLGARLRGKAPDRNRAEALLERLGLASAAAARPATLSGGMRQRVALARTLMEDRPLVLMDEPFSALDPVTRESIQDLACELLADRAVLLVTHDPAEACRIADRIFVLSGRPAALRLIAELPQGKPRDVLSTDLLATLRGVHEALRQADRELRQ